MIELNQIKIVYPSGSRMEALAKQLARKLERYRIPSGVKKRTGIKRVQEIAVPWLIVLCTPDTPKDPEILSQIDTYIARGFFSHVLTLLADGTPETSFPEALLHETLPDGTVVDHEPLAANVAGTSGMKRSRQLKVERLRLLAPMLGVTFDDLMNRRQRQQVRIVTAIGSAVLVLGIIFLVLLIRRLRVFQEQNVQLNAHYELMSELAKDAQDAADAAGAEYDAAAAEVTLNVLSGGDCELAMLLCLDVLEEVEDAPKTAAVLENALKMRTAAGYVPVSSAADAQNLESEQAEGPEAGEDAPGAQEADEIISSLPEEYGTQWRRELSSEGYLLGVRGETQLIVYDPAAGQTIASRKAFSYPVTVEDTVFAGEEDPETGRRSAQLIRCGGILFEYREKEEQVPEDILGRMGMAVELLGGRTLTQQERTKYGIAE